MQHVAVGIIFRNGTLLVCQRKRGARYELQWEFPGGKLEAGETIEGCLRRELQEELSIKAGPIEKVQTEVSHYDDGSSYTVHYCHIRSFNGALRNNVFESIRWVTPEELLNLNILQGNQNIVKALTSRPFPPGA